MSQDSRNFKCVSSLVIFRKMYERQQSIYDIISEFAKTIIISHNLTVFELHEMCNLLKEEYGVLIVPAVVKAALKKLTFLKREKNIYTLEKSLSDKEVEYVKEQISQSRSSITDILNEYVKFKKVKSKIEEFDESSAKEEFCRFIVDGNLNDEFNIGIISAFIVERKGNIDFEQACKCIREGLIIYNGLSYTPEGELGEKFDKPLTVYLETELLFHATGLNGILYKSLFSDFYQVVSDINDVTFRNYGKKMITLAYFPETKKEVNNYFAQAESIVKNQRKIDPSKPAMVTILKECVSIADVKQKEIEFWKEIEREGIIEDDMHFDITNDYYAKYNLSVVGDVSEEGACEDANKAYDIGQMLSKVNYLRRDINRNVFRTIKAVILTGNRKTLSLSDKYTQSQEVPFATTLSYLTNRFWYSLHKGIFPENSIVPGANIITMAQIAFSQKVNESLTSEYKKIKKQFDDGTITQEKVNEIIAGFKVNYLQPENVTKEIIDEDFCFDLFNGEAIEQAKAERSIERQKFVDEISCKAQELADKNKILDKLFEEKNKQEVQKYHEALAEYKVLRQSSIYKSIHKQWLMQTVIAIAYAATSIVSIIFAYYFKRECWAGVPLLIAIAIPILERYIRPFANKYVLKAYSWIFLKKERMNFTAKIIEEYTNRNPRPKMIVSRIEDYSAN